jgi:glycosyltransferase involved in cell wall biosynthesis
MLAVRPGEHDGQMTDDQSQPRRALLSPVAELDGQRGPGNSVVPTSRVHYPLTSTWPARISVVIPAFSEADNLRWLLPQLASSYEVVIVDGDSTDDTANVVRELCPQATLIRQRPRGKGAALRAGFAAATGDIVVMIDADGSMDPLEIHTFAALIARGFDVVKGSRYSCGGGSEDLTFIRRMGNRVFVRIANVMYGTGWSDLCYGYIAMRRSALDRLRLHSDGFEIETEICVHAVTANLSVAEVPSFELNRRNGVSHLHPFRDGWRVLRVLLRNRLRRRREFARWLKVCQLPMEHAELEPAD